MKIAVIMILRMLLRQSFVVLLIFVIPVIFLSIVELTSSDNPFPIILQDNGADVNQFHPEHEISLVYYAIASCGFLVAFISLYLIQQNQTVNKRLVLCGFHPSMLLLATFLVLIVIIVVIGLFVGSLTFLFHRFADFTGFISGLYLIGFVYGSYGLLIGSILKKELEGILMIVLLVNIDVGWLQNPIFFWQAENKDFIRYLPGYNPSQATLIHAFSDFSPHSYYVNSILYGCAFMLLAIVIYFLRMKVHRRNV